MSAQSTFSYRARDTSGEIVTGSLSASSQEEVGTQLRREGKYLLEVTNAPAAANLDAKNIRRNETAKRVKREDVIAFCQQLAVMIETGVPLTEALDSFSRQFPQSEFRVVLDAINNDICAGEPFSNAMARWPRVFPTMVISLMKASEASGTMAMMLGRVGDYLAKERKTAKQIKGALSYPLFMMGFGILMTIFLMVFILPRFAKIYEGKGATLPAMTRVLLNVSEFFTTQYLYYGPALATIIITALLWSRFPSWRRTLDWLRLHAPLLGPMFAQLYITRAARTMATLLGAGVNLLDIITICKGVTNNVRFDQLWIKMEADIRDGKQMSEAITCSPYIPPNVCSMIAAGETSGRLADVMERIAVFSEEELDSAVKKITSLIEPIMIVFMGIMVGGVAMALLLPIFKMGNVMAGKG